MKPGDSAESERLAASPGFLHTLLDELANRYAAGAFRDEAAQAKDDYFTRAGKVFEDDGELFEARMAAFTEWFLLDRPLARGVTPVLDALATPGDEATALALARLATSHRSLFDVSAVAGNEVELEDVFGGARFRVTERRSTVGFEVGDLAEARLLWDGAEVIFGKTFLFHPGAAREEILNHVDAAIARRAPADDVLFQLSRLHLRWRRLGHVPAAKVYKSE